MAGDSGRKRRFRNLSVEKPIVTGSVAFYLGKGQASEERSHRWTVYVRGLHGEDISAFVKRAVFKLHPSFSRPVRVVEHFPFEITEYGWGEFEIAIELQFTDSSQPPIELHHPLKLYPPPDCAVTVKKPVVIELYDEILFSDPSEKLYEALVDDPKLPSVPHPLSVYWLSFDEAEQIKRLQEIEKRIVAQEESQWSEKLQKAEVALRDLQRRLRDADAAALGTPRAESQPQGGG